MSKIMTPQLRQLVFDGIETRLEAYLQGRVYPMEIATTFNFVLYDEFARKRPDTHDSEYQKVMEEIMIKGRVPSPDDFEKSLKPVFVGEYFVDPKNPEQTRVYCHQGTEACSPIPITKGVIGRAIRTGLDQLVRDVTKDPEHVGCDPNMEGTEAVLVSWSEPYSKGRWEGYSVPLGVLDLDFNVKEALDEQDLGRLRKIWDNYGKLIFPGEPEFEAPENMSTRPV